MGIAESKLLVASFSRACSEAEKTGSPSQNILADPLVQSQIKNILSDPRVSGPRNAVLFQLFTQTRQVASYATPIWKELPAVARNKITGRQSPTQRTIKKSQTAITLPSDLGEFVNKCKEHPNYFFESIGRKFDLCLPIFAQCYQFLADRTLNKLQRRTFLVIFARLKARLGHARLSAAARELLIFILLRAGFVFESASDIYENFGDWASRGERYEALAAACGGLDVFFVLPDDISDLFWEKDLPKSGKEHDDMIATLHQRGVRRSVEELSDVSILEDVIGYIWPRLEEEITKAMKRHEDSRPQHSAHLPTPNADGSQQSAHIPTGDPDTFHRGETTAHAPTPNADGSRPMLLAVNVGALSAISGQGSAPRKQHTNHNPASQTLADPGANLQSQLEMTCGDDGAIHPLPEDQISTNDPAHQTSVDHPGTSNQIENRRSISSSSSISESTDNSPYYSDPGGAGAVECHNDSFSKQVHNGWRLSPIVELSLEEREAAQMLQQQTQPTSDPPSSQQLGEMSVRNATRECPQGMSSDQCLPEPYHRSSRRKGNKVVQLVLKSLG
ncbi:hypothetical protein RJZ57_008476 [Blastomyces gilchristii]